MSSVYVSEPPTRGKVVLKTTAGDIDIELWPKEAPRAVRNFVQHALEGYYDGTLFHRVVKGFVVQGGDPTGSGEGGESVYADGAPFPAEFHQRLRFTHRGIVAMAGTDKNDNRSQFFITLTNCEELNGMNTIFGKVTGDSLYNVLQMGDLEVGEDDRPVYPPEIRGCEVLDNPFPDIVPRPGQRRQQASSAQPKAREAAQQAATRDMKLLSFGDEEDDAAADVPPPKKKLRPDSGTARPDKSQPAPAATAAAASPAAAAAAAAPAQGAAATSTPAEGDAEKAREEEARPSGTGDDAKDFAAKMKRRVLEQKEKQKAAAAAANDAHDGGASEGAESSGQRQKETRAEKLSFKTRPETPGEEEQAPPAAAGLMGRPPPVDPEVAAAAAAAQRKPTFTGEEVEIRRRPKRSANEDAVLARLEGFKKRLAVSSLLGKRDGDGKDDAQQKVARVRNGELEADSSGWLSHELVFEKQSRVIDPMARPDEQYETFDPRKHSSSSASGDRHRDSDRDHRDRSRDRGRDSDRGHRRDDSDVRNKSR
eukprot:m51a1_g4333 putative peptidyl-prolyl cis-trans isomerase cwc27 homolog (537) ;mRNA; r:146118-147934